MSYADNVVRWLRERLDQDPPLAQPRELTLALRVLALWRASLIVDAFVARHGRRVLQGPFAGMAYVEGAEEELLRPDLAPALAHTHIIVEAHEVYRPGVAARLTERFAPTHRVTQLAMGGRTLPLPDWLVASNHLDQLLAVWEWRLGPTPWLVMRPKSLNA